jgi:hypothetical protein
MEKKQGVFNVDRGAAGKWEMKRNMGKLKYVLWNGVIGFGVSIAILLTLFEWISYQTITSMWVIMRLLIFPIIGSLISNVRWASQENKFALYNESAKEQ